MSAPSLLSKVIAALVVGLKSALMPGWTLGLPAGDLVVWLERFFGAANMRVARVAEASLGSLPNLYPVHVRMTRALLWTERKITSLPVAGFLILALGGLLWLVTLLF